MKNLISLYHGSTLFEKMNMTRFLFLLTFVFFMGTCEVFSGPDEFLEKFAISEDRQKVLEDLIPGTEDFYFYHCLHAQNTGDLKKVRELLGPWRTKLGGTSRYREISHRQALLEIEGDPERSIKYLKKHLGLRFNHFQEKQQEAFSAPSVLDPKLISFEFLKSKVISKNPYNLRGLTDDGLNKLNPKKLNLKQKRAFLKRIDQPDWEGLPEMIAEYVNYFIFRSLDIHKQLLLPQLMKLLELKPELKNSQVFVQEILLRLRPNPDLAWQGLTAEKLSYLDRLLKFSRSLPSSQNSLKAFVLYHKLYDDLQRGEHNLKLFLEYLNIPRNGLFVHPKFRQANRSVLGDLGSRLNKETLLERVSTDEKLLKDYLVFFYA